MVRGCHMATKKVRSCFAMLKSAGDSYFKPNALLYHTSYRNMLTIKWRIIWRLFILLVVNPCGEVEIVEIVEVLLLLSHLTNILQFLDIILRRRYTLMFKTIFISVNSRYSFIMGVNLFVAIWQLRTVK